MSGKMRYVPAQVVNLGGTCLLTSFAHLGMTSYLCSL